MGEYAIRCVDQQEIKIGTCESMYYLRADQRSQVSALSGNVDPGGADALSIRFRFPWPDEDHIQPGEFDPYGRSIAVPGATVPAGVGHYTVQFSAEPGYLISLPCPEGTPNADIHRNGFAGAVQLTQQKFLADGRLVPVCQCGGCGALWRVEDQPEIEALAVAFRVEADRRERQGMRNGTGAQDRRFWDAIADRILAGTMIDPVLIRLGRDWDANTLANGEPIL